VSRLATRLSALPSNVRVLGAVSFANDVAGEMLYPVLPLFLTLTLHAPVSIVGVIEGVAEAVAVAFSGLVGPLADRRGGLRRPWLTAGYAIATIGRAVIAVAGAWGVVLAARVVDRFGKALRTAPRDALIRDASDPERVGASFGYHRSMDAAGAVAGPLIAVGILEAGGGLRTVLLAAVLPGFAALYLLRRLRERPVAPVPRAAPGRSHLRELPRAFWWTCAIVALQALGNSSDAFLLLRAHSLGLSTALVVLAYSGYNVVYALGAWPLGSLSDRVPRTWLLGCGYAVFGLVQVGFALASVAWAVWPLLATYGIYIAATDGVARAIVADHAPRRLAATSYGVLQSLAGASALAASIAAGLLWTSISPRAPFVLGAAMTGLALAVLLVARLTRRV